MMKNVLSVLILILSIIGAGCVSTPVPPADARVTVAPDLARRVYVTSVRCVQEPSGFCRFQANLHNNTNSQVRVEYKVQWLDADGMEVESVVSTWQFLAIQPMEIKGLGCMASSKDAVDFRFYVRSFKR